MYKNTIAVIKANDENNKAVLEVAARFQSAFQTELMFVIDDMSRAEDPERIQEIEKKVQEIAHEKSIGFSEMMYTDAERLSDFLNREMKDIDGETLIVMPAETRSFIDRVMRTGSPVRMSNWLNASVLLVPCSHQEDGISTEGVLDMLLPEAPALEIPVPEPRLSHRLREFAKPALEPISNDTVQSNEERPLRKRTSLIAMVIALTLTLTGLVSSTVHATVSPGEVRILEPVLENRVVSEACDVIPEKIYAVFDEMEERNDELERLVDKKIYDNPFVSAANVDVYANKEMITLAGTVKTNRARLAALNSVSQSFNIPVIDFICIEEDRNQASESS